MAAGNWPAKQVKGGETCVRFCVGPPSGQESALNVAHHRTWTGSRWMFEKMCNAEVRMLKACLKPHRAEQNQAQNTRLTCI